MNGPRWAAARLRALGVAGWRCGRCGRSGRLEVHHKLPLHRGGALYDPENLAALCRGCHIDAQGTTDVEEPEPAWVSRANRVLCFFGGHAWSTQIVLLGESSRDCGRCGKHEDLVMGFTNQ